MRFLKAVSLAFAALEALVLPIAASAHRARMPNSGVRGFRGALVVVVVLATIASSIVSSAAGMSPRRPMAMPGIPPDAMQHMEHPSKAAWIPYAPALDPDGWWVSASSAAAGHPARAVLGSRRSAYWQSARLGRHARLPQSITIRLPSAELVSGLTYVPRRRLGEIGRFRVTLSRDGRRFGRTVAYGRWQANATDKQVAWMPRVVRAVRLTALSVSPVRAREVAAARIVLTGARPGATAGAPSAAAPNAPAGPSAVGQAGPTIGAGANAPAGPSVVGQWGPTIGFPLVPVAAALIPGNKLVVWSADEDLSFGSDTSPYTQTAILDLTTGAVTAATISNTAHNLFCPGVSILPNGDVMVTGGISDTLTSIYNPVTNTWSAGPQMNVGRGYQGQTTLSDGQVFVLGGSWSGATGGKLGEVWSSTGDWRELTNVPANPIYTADAQGVYRADNHGWFIATSGGKVFHAGPSAQMHWITTTGAGSITPAGNRGNAGDQMNGNAVLYDVGKILTVGGAPSYQDSNATAAANIVDISTDTAQVKSTSSMEYQRAFANSVALPTGQVFTVGGESHAVPFSDQNSDMSPEMWNPSNGKWTVMASQSEPRNYHSVGVLLPDGTVFSGGGGLCGSCATNHPDGQIFYPPYLFNSDGSRRARPTISSAPSTAITGQTISVTTGGPVQSFVLMRYDEATHAVDNDQRRIPLTITSSSGDTFQLAIPSDPGVALAGPYMLFAIDATGTPSVSATISISTPALSVPSTSYGKTVDSTGPAVYWPLADSNGSTGAADLSGNRDTGAFSSLGITYQTPSPAEGSSGQGVTLNGGQIISTQPQATPSTYSEELWFKTASRSGGVLTRFGDSPTGADATNDRVLYMTSSGQLFFGTWTGEINMVTSPRSYNDDSWHSAVITQGSDGMHMYVDGAQVASSSVTGAQSYTGYWQLGGTVTAGWPNQPSGAFSGSISDAAMYQSELTPGQIQAQYLASPAS
jgi:galactose oxidase